ncbi:hypothetical protein PIB30_024859 [Stylosanthes scabra]|uniref:Uncharacterized protein n=1 Tax=Stylosanthes scabra TaxID=79078 RepID=A0ABU6Z7H1_9FABA|nr:hypothetical protein [Stylosanthes scabra]
MQKLAKLIGMRRGWMQLLERQRQTEAVNRPPPKPPNLPLVPVGSGTVVKAWVDGVETETNGQDLQPLRDVDEAGTNVEVGASVRGKWTGAIATATDGGLRARRLRRFVLLTSSPLLAAVLPWNRSGEREEWSRDGLQQRAERSSEDNVGDTAKGAFEAARSSTVVTEEIHAKEHLHFYSETAAPWRPVETRLHGARPLPIMTANVVDMVGSGAATMAARGLWFCRMREGAISTIALVGYGPEIFVGAQFSGAHFLKIQLQVFRQHSTIIQAQNNSF